MANFADIAQQFTNHYYKTFDESRAKLTSLYRDVSMLTWEGSQILGAKAISEKLESLPFKTVQHKVTTLDAQPSSPTIGSIIVMVTGLLVVDGEETALQFSQTFNLVPEGEVYWVYNDIFRLNYGS